MSQNLYINTLDYIDHEELYLKLKEEERKTLDIDFGLYPDITKSRYLDIYEDIYQRWWLPTNLLKIQI